MSNWRIVSVATVAGALMALGGCATTAEPEFGSSVRHMVTGQTWNPAAPAEGLSGADGQKAASAVEAYRSGGKDKAAAPSPPLLMPTQQ